jgi:Lrp/AsnC family leucine-responsive transcriptional regulator
MLINDLDNIDLLLLSALSENSRASVSDLAQTVGLTRQTVTERLNRLRSDGIIARFTIGVHPEKIGLAVRAYIAITMLPTCTEAEERQVIALLKANPYVQECYRVTGEDYFQIRVVAPGIDALKDLVLLLRGTHVVQNTRTLLALEVCFEKSALRLPL